VGLCYFFLIININISNPPIRNILSVSQLILEPKAKPPPPSAINKPIITIQPPIGNAPPREANTPNTTNAIPIPTSPAKAPIPVFLDPIK